MLHMTPAYPNRRTRRAAVALGAVLTAMLSATLAWAPLSAAAPQSPEDHLTKVQILEPANGTQVAYGNFFQDVHFAAKATSNWGDCCTIKWTSNVDGVLGITKTFDHAFLTPGKRVITATATSSKGTKGSATVILDVENHAPSVWIDKPAANVQLYSKVQYKFQGSSHDENEQGLPCGSLKWSTTPSTMWQPSGCGSVTQFPFAGVYKIQLDAKDAYGLSAKPAIKTVSVIDKPKDSPPSVSIVLPDDGGFLEPSTTYSLKALGSDVDNDPITYAWTVKYNSTTKPIGNGGPQISWKPEIDVPYKECGKPVTLTVTATETGSGKSATDSIDSLVWWSC